MIFLEAILVLKWKTNISQIESRMKKEIKPNWKGRSSQTGWSKPKCIHENQTGHSSNKETRISPIGEKMKFKSTKTTMWEAGEDEAEKIT